LERSDYPGGVSHKKLWEMSRFQPDVANQQAILPLGESSAIVYSEQTSCACGTPVAAPRQPVPPEVKHSAMRKHRRSFLRLRRSDSNA